MALRLSSLSLPNANTLARRASKGQSLPDTARQKAASNASQMLNKVMREASAAANTGQQGMPQLKSVNDSNFLEQLQKNSNVKQIEVQSIMNSTLGRAKDIGSVS